MQPDCTCYVRSLPPADRFAIRDGAHSPLCPDYRPSLDPVDRADDDLLAQRLEQTAGVVGEGRSW